MDTADLYYTESSRRTNEQNESRRHFDTMATTVLATSGVIASIMAFTLPHWVCWSTYPAIAVLVAFGLVAISIIRVVCPPRWLFNPRLSKVLEHIISEEYTGEELTVWAAKQQMDVMKNNEDKLATKAKWLTASYLFLSMEVIALGILILSVAV